MKELEGHPGKKRIASAILYYFGYIVLRLRYQIKAEGIGNLPKEGPLLILVKHQRLDDIPLGYPWVIKSANRKDFYALMKSSLADPKFFGFFLKCGGIPLDRKNPEKSREELLYCREILYEGKHMLAMFPEQTYFPDKMGKGKLPGFRFITGHPEIPLAIACMGFRYQKGFFRTKVTIRIGKPTYLTKDSNHAHFLHDRMLEIAELSNLDYHFDPPSIDEEKSIDH